MNYQEELQQLETLKRKNLHQLTAMYGECLENWELCQEINKELRLIEFREMQRIKDGFNRQQPSLSGSWHRLEPLAQLELQQKFQKQMQEFNVDESAKPKLMEKWRASRKSATEKGKCVEELLHLFSNLSRLLFAVGRSEEAEEAVEETGENEE